MPIMYVLIIIYGGYGGLITVNGFTSKKSCEIAAEIVDKDRHKLSSICLPIQ